MSKNVCETLLDILATVGTQQLFGMTGDALNPLLDAIRRDGRFEWIGVRHEEAGAFAAAAQAKLTGNLGVCCGTVGPGAIHLLNGLYDAKRDHAPVLAITGHVPLTEQGTSYFQEVDIRNLFQDICVYNEFINSPAQLPRVAQQAVQTALTQGGVDHDTESKNDALPYRTQSCRGYSQSRRKNNHTRRRWLPWITRGTTGRGRKAEGANRTNPTWSRRHRI